MWSPVVSSSAFALLVFTSGVSAHRSFDWVKKGLSDCWQECLADTSDGCNSSKCICGASQSNTYLPSAIRSMVKQCDAEAWALETTFLSPLQWYCSAVGSDIPDDIISSAYAAATATATATSAAPLTTRKVEHSDKPSSPKTTDKGAAELTAVFTSTKTMTTTNGDGQTLQIIVPVVMGPSTISFGKTVTSTLSGKGSVTSATSSPTSAPASPSPTSEAAAPASTQVQQQQPEVVSSTTSAQAPKKTSNANGSLFENPQADASRWGVSGVVVGMGVVAGLFMRL